MTHSTRVRLCLLCFTLTCCDFEPGGQIFTTVPQATTEGLTIVLENHPEQTIELKEETLFRYSVDPQDKKLIETRALLDGSIVWTSAQPNGSFRLDPRELETGSYQLRIEFAAASGTGSLSDKLGAEFIYVWTERTIRVDNEIPEGPADANAIVITAIENVDYSIKVNWTAYNSFNFEKYEVLRRDYDKKGTLKTERTIPAMSSDPKHTYLFDRMYLGGKSEYLIKVYAAGKTYTSPPFAYQHAYEPNIAYEIKADGNVTISWRSLAALRNNFESYKLEIIDNIGGFTDRVTFDITSVTDTTVTFVPDNFRFGKIKQIKLNIYPVVANSFYTQTHDAPLRYGKRFPAFDPYNLPLRFNVDTRKFYFRRHDIPTQSIWLIVADEDGKSSDSLQFFQGSVEINNTIGIRSDNGQNYRINLTTMEEEGPTSLPAGSLYDLSDDNKAFLYTAHGRKIFTLDGVELLSFGFATANGYQGISPNGQYVFAPPYIYRFNGTEFEQSVPWLGFNILTASFPPQEPTKVLFAEKERIRKYNIETNSYELTSTAYTGPCNLDPVTNRLGCLNGDQFVILNSDNFELYKTVPVQGDAGLFYLLNGKVICSSGTQIELSHIP